MSEITNAIKKIAKMPSAVDIGKAVNVREDEALCDVEIAGKATALDARLTMGDRENLWFLPKEGSDVIVAWVDGVVPVVVTVLSAEKAIWKGEDFFEKMNEFVKKFNEHTHSVDVSAVTYISPAGTPTPVTGSASAKAPSSSVEEFKE